MKSVLTIGASVFAIALAARVVLPAQTPSFRAGVEIVDVDVSVLDKFRQPIHDLKASDFTVLEDGKPRPIVAFTPVDLPGRAMQSAQWMSDVAPDTQTNDLQREGRLVVVLLDRSIATIDVTQAQKIAESAIDQLRPDDLAAVVYTEYGVPQNFTADRRRLLAAVQQPAVGLPEDDHGESSSCFCNTCTLDRIGEIANAVREVRQRRKILFVIGSNIAVTSRGGCSAAIGDARTRAFRAVGAANLTVYVLDPSGIPTLLSNASVARAAASGRASQANMQRLSNLRLLPEQTGGRAILNNAPATAMPELFRESNSYYVLGFTPAHADGKFHDISVKVGKENVILQARRGFYAGGAARAAPASVPKGVRPDLHAAMAGLWPKTDLPLTVAATTLATAGLRTASVAVLLGVEREPVPGRPAAALTADTVNVLVSAFDRNGKTLAYEQGTARVVAQPVANGRSRYEVLAQLQLKPGRYEIRAAVEDPIAGQTGSVYTYVDVPNFLDEFLSLSGILLYTNPGELNGVLNADRHERLPIVPTMRRVFSRGDRVGAWLQVYQGLRRPAMDGYVLMEIRDETDARVFHRETRVLTTDVGDNRAITLDTDLPISELPPGQYVLAAEIRQGNRNVRRDVRFSVR